MMSLLRCWGESEGVFKKARRHMKISGLMRSDYYTSEPQDVTRNDCKVFSGLDLKR
jgi:hypothetical protein